MHLAQRATRRDQQFLLGTHWLSRDTQVCSLGGPISKVDYRRNRHCGHRSRFVVQPQGGACCKNSVCHLLIAATVANADDNHHVVTPPGVR